MRNNTSDFDVLHPSTIWSVIKGDIEIKIINGEYKGAEKLPSISELASIYNVGKSTAQKALEALYRDGIITKRKAVGYYVVPFKRDILRNKHVQILIKGFEQYINYAERIGMSKCDIEDLKEFLYKKVKNITHGE